MGDRPTDEQITEAVEHLVESLANHRCHICGEPIYHYDQVGGSVYARPCNHRIGRGTAPKQKPGIYQTTFFGTEARNDRATS